MKFAILIFLAAWMSAAFAIQSRLPTARFMAAQLIPPKEEQVSKISMALQMVKYEGGQLLKWSMRSTYISLLVAFAPIGDIFPDTRYKIIAMIIGALIVNEGLEKLAYAIYTHDNKSPFPSPSIQSTAPLPPVDPHPSSPAGTKRL